MEQTRLPQTDDILVQGEANFSLSPNGQWLFFQSNQGRATAPLYILYDIAGQVRYPIGMTPEVGALLNEGRGFLQHIGCWQADSARLFLPGVDTTTVFVTAVGIAQPQWSVSARLSRDEFRRIYECPTQTSDPTTIVQVAQPSAQRIDLLDAQTGNQVLATHESTPLESRIALTYLAVAPDQTALAYVLTGYRGSFIARAEGFVLSRTAGAAGPQRLAEKIVGPLRWGPQGKVIYGVVGQKNGALSLSAWSIP